MDLSFHLISKAKRISTVGKGLGKGSLQLTESLPTGGPLRFRLRLGCASQYGFFDSLQTAVLVQMIYE
jgi:hypothetical protein